MSNERIETQGLNEETAFREPGVVPTPVDVSALQQGVISRNAPRQLSPMGKALAWVLSVLLVLTCWNTYALEEAKRMIIGDDAVPMASGNGGDEILDDLDDGDTSQMANKSDDAEAADEGSEDGDEAADTGDDAAADDIVSEADMPAYLPENLLDAEKVLPQLSDDAQQKKTEGIQNAASHSDEELAAALGARAAFSLSATGAWRASDEAFQVAAGSLTLVPSLGNLALSLEGGYLGGAEDADAVALTFTAPYLYQNAAGEWVRTNSAEDWKAHGGEAANARAVLSFPGLPAGWTVYTEHMGQYLKHTAEEAAAGLSGTIVVRFDGVQDEHGITVNETRGQLPAGTALPGAIATLTENTPAAEAVEVSVAATVNSYTAPRNEDGTPILADDNKTRKIEDVRYVAAEDAPVTVKLTNAEPQVALTTKVEPVGEPVMENGTGWMAYLITLESAKGAIAEKGYTLRVADQPDTAEGAGAVNAAGIVAFDATGLTAQDLATVNPADPATAEALLAEADKDKPEEKRRALAAVTPVSDGVADVSIATNEGDALTYDAMEGKAENNRVIYVAVPYGEGALTVPTIEVAPEAVEGDNAEGEGDASEGAEPTEVPDPDATTYNPETFALTLTAAVNVKAVQEENVAGAATVNDTLADEDATYI